LRIGITANKAIPLKYKLQVKAEWAECDLASTYREKFCPILASLGWTL
jgi:hypothetical protein